MPVGGALAAFLRWEGCFHMQKNSCHEQTTVCVRVASSDLFSHKPTE